jgi:hypothetical protein
LEKDVAGIISYVELLIGGNGRATKTGKPLGDRFFLKTGGQCKDYKTSKTVQRDMYISNVPNGQIPFLSEMSGFNFTSLEGLIPGIFSNLDALNPLQLFSAFMEGETPLCAEVKLPTIDENNNRSSKSGYIPISELKQLESSNDIPKGTVTSDMSKSLNKHVDSNEGFVNINDLVDNNFISSKNNIHKKCDSFTNLYLISISLLFLYLTFKVVNRK